MKIILKKTAIIFLILTTFIISANANDEAVKITVKPQQVYIERGASQQFLNFDFLLENLTENNLKISSIKVSVYDDYGKFILRRIIDRHGLSPAIFTIPQIDLEAKNSLYLFNPFYSFDNTLNVKTMKYEFVFSSEKDEMQYKSETVIEPVIYETKTNLTLPLTGRVIVEAGHDFYAPHRRIDLTSPIAKQVGLKANSARFAGDFTIVNINGELYKNKGENLTDWFAYHAPVFASGSGKIITLVDEIPDNMLDKGNVVFAKELSLEKPSGIFGNYLVIDHGNGEYSLFAHLEKGSFKVKIGDFIKQGQQIAQIGFSGNTDFVHTHYQLQDNANPTIAEGLPAYFQNFRRILGSKILPVKKGTIDTGMVLEK